VAIAEHDEGHAADPDPRGLALTRQHLVGVVGPPSTRATSPASSPCSAATSASTARLAHVPPLVEVRRKSASASRAAAAPGRVPASACRISRWASAVLGAAAIRSKR
jgi:hypothetical protein